MRSAYYGRLTEQIISLVQKALDYCRVVGNNAVHREIDSMIRPKLLRICFDDQFHSGDR